MYRLIFCGMSLELVNNSVLLDTCQDVTDLFRQIISYSLFCETLKFQLIAYSEEIKLIKLGIDS